MAEHTDRYAGKRMAEKVNDPDDVKVNRKSKDSVFTDLFDHPEYLIQLYRVLHPEDTESDESDLTVVTLDSLMLREQYNDLGFMVGNRLMVLVEAQSTWSVNIVVRFFLYLADTYRKYINRNPGLRLYSSKKLDLPRPELYLIYTGKRKKGPEMISLTKDIFGTDDCCVEVKAKVLYDSVSGDILNQYIKFTRIFDEQVALHGYTREAVLETIRICRDRDVLRAYLAEEEAADIMFRVIDREQEIERYLNEERQEARKQGLDQGFAEGLAEGREKGLAEGREKGLAEGREKGLAEGREKGLAEGKEEGKAEGRDETIRMNLQKLMSTMNLSLSQAMDALGIAAEDREKYAAKL